MSSFIVLFVFDVVTLVEGLLIVEEGDIDYLRDSCCLIMRSKIFRGFRA